MMKFKGDNPFIRTYSRNSEDKINKGQFTPTRKEIDFIPVDEDDKEYSDKHLHDQIKSTVSSFKEKTIKHEEEIFYSIYPAVPLSDPNIETILVRLKADIIDIDTDTQEFTVRGSNTQLTKYGEKGKLPKLFMENIRMIKPLSVKQQITQKSKRYIQQGRPAIIGIMPNNKPEQQMEYLKLTEKYLNQKKIDNFASLEDEGLIFADISLDDILEFLDKSTFVYFVESAPFGIVNEIKSKSKSKSSKTTSSVSMIEPLTKSYELPLVAVLDSGVNKISQLSELVVENDSYKYDNPYDITGNNGHGTPVAALLSLGEDLDSPKVKIISYKIFENDDDEQPFWGMFEGVKKYRNKTRIFHSSVNFQDLNPKLEAQLDQLIQKSNIVFVNSAGNIMPEDIESELKTLSYPDYLEKYESLSPSYAPSVVSVGSVSSKVYSGSDNTVKSIANINEVAPYSRCSPKNPYLFDCKKPDLVESGANINERNGEINLDDVGMDSFNNNGNVVSFFGTSMSAPLFTRKIAEIDSYYGSTIENAETLKALAYTSCIPLNSTCSGLGKANLTLGCDDDHALYYVEGNVSLRGENTPKYYENPYSEFTIKVPFSTAQIDLCVVHTDNFSLTNSIILNTHLKIDAWKTASASKVDPIYNENNKKITNVKFLKYSFKQRNMEGKWTFRIFPQLTSKIPTRYKKDLQVRYGATILLSRRSSSNRMDSMNREIHSM